MHCGVCLEGCILFGCALCEPPQKTLRNTECWIETTWKDDCSSEPAGLGFFLDFESRAQVDKLLGLECGAEMIEM